MILDGKIMVHSGNDYPARIATAIKILPLPWYMFNRKTEKSQTLWSNSTIFKTIGMIIGSAADLSFFTGFLLSKSNSSLSSPGKSQSNTSQDSKKKI